MFIYELLFTCHSIYICNSHNYFAYHFAWSRGDRADRGPLQVARAALLMPPKLVESSVNVIHAVAVPLLDKGLEAVEELKTSNWELERQLAAQKQRVADQVVASSAELRRAQFS